MGTAHHRTDVADTPGDRPTDPAAWADDLDRDLRAAGTPERAEQERAYLKSSIRHYGVPVPAGRALARSFTGTHRDLGHDDLCDLVEVLWAEPVFERRRLAVELLKLFGERLGPDDVAMLERLLRASSTWALVDEIAPRVVGPLVVQHPDLAGTLDRWAADEDFWVRRAAVLTLLLPLRAGGGDFARFARYADDLLADREFFVRKALGWVLRETAGKRPALVFDWLLPRAALASGVTLREAVKPLSPTQRAAVLAAR